MDATMMMGLRVLVRFTTRSVIFISFCMFIIISDTVRCLVVLYDSPLLYYNKNSNGIASCQEIHSINESITNKSQMTDDEQTAQLHHA